MGYQDIIDGIPNLTKEERIIIGDCVVESLKQEGHISLPVFQVWEAAKAGYRLGKETDYSSDEV